MIRINLLPYRAARTKENIRRQVSIFLLSLVLLIVILGAGFGYLKNKAVQLSIKLDDIKKEVAIYEAKATEVEAIKKKLATLEKQIEIVNQLKTDREKPPVLLSEITETVVPGRMEFIRMNVSPANVIIDGAALDNETVAKFMLRLEQSRLFSDVDLNSAKQISRYGIKMKQFQIICKRAADVPPAATVAAK